MVIWYDKQGREISMEEANTLLGIPGYKRVALTEVTSATDPDIKYRISTVWLGINHNWGGNAPLLIFETMVFPGERVDDDGWAEMLCERYPDEMSAKLGHQEIVITVAATVPDEVITHDPEEWDGRG